MFKKDNPVIDISSNPYENTKLGNTIYTDVGKITVKIEGNDFKQILRPRGLSHNSYFGYKYYYDEVSRVLVTMSFIPEDPNTGFLYFYHLDIGNKLFIFKKIMTFTAYFSSENNTNYSKVIDGKVRQFFRDSFNIPIPVTSGEIDNKNKYQTFLDKIFSLTNI